MRNRSRSCCAGVWSENSSTRKAIFRNGFKLSKRLTAPGPCKRLSTPAWVARLGRRSGVALSRPSLATHAGVESRLQGPGAVNLLESLKPLRKIAFLVEEFSLQTPAQQLLDRFLIGYPRDGKFHRPPE